MQAPLRSLATHIRHQTGFGTEIASFYLEVMRGNPIRMPGRTIKKGKNGRKISVLYIRPTLDQRIDAAAWLADRGWGKAKETIELTGEASPAQRLELLKRLSEDERAQLRGLLQRALEGKQESTETGTQDAVIDVPATVDDTHSEAEPVPVTPRPGGMTLGPRIGRRPQDANNLTPVRTTGSTAEPQNEAPQNQEPCQES